MSAEQKHEHRDEDLAAELTGMRAALTKTQALARKVETQVRDLLSVPPVVPDRNPPTVLVVEDGLRIASLILLPRVGRCLKTM
jgi:hypothetical protein